MFVTEARGASCCHHRRVCSNGLDSEINQATPVVFGAPSTYLQVRPTVVTQFVADNPHSANMRNIRKQAVLRLDPSNWVLGTGYWVRKTIRD